MGETVTFKWNIGFPDKNGVFLVDLTDGEKVVTPYRVTPRRDTYGFLSRTGWVCLTGSHARVKRWVDIKELSND